MKIPGTVDLPARYSQLSQEEKRGVRIQYAQLQEGNCFYCKSPLAFDPPKEVTDKKINWKYFPPNFLKYPLHLQHNHDTDMTEGVVHAYCNAVMWQYERR